MRTVLDTNIVVSALLFRGKAAAIHRAILGGKIEPYICPEILQEYTRVLAYPKFGLSNADITYLLQEEIAVWCHTIADAIDDRQWIPEDAADDVFINAARAVPGCVLVSGDSHILSRRDSLPVRVFSVSELLQELDCLPPAP